jgi:hypothetical protein
MALDPNISLGVRQMELANPLAQYGQIAAIQNAQNQNQLAQFQLGAAQRADLAAAAQNELYARHFDPTKGAVDVNAFVAEAAKRGQGGIIPGFLKTEAERKAAAATLKKTETEIDEKQFKLQQDKLNYGLKSLGDSPTPQDAIRKLNEGVTKGYFDFSTANSEAQKLQSMTPEQYKQYRIEKVLGLVDAKDKLGFMLPKNVRQEAGGKIVTIQDNPMLAGYSQPIAGMDITKTATIGDITAQGQLKLAKDKFAFEQANPTLSIQEDPSGLVAVNTKTGMATPVVYGSSGFQAAPTAAPAAPVATPVAGPSVMRPQGAGMPGQRLPAIPGMASVLDQTATPVVSPTQVPNIPLAGTRVMGKGESLTEGERKSATLLQRLQGSQNQLTQALLDDPKAAGPQAFATAVGKLSTTAANLFNTEARQRVEAAQLDILDAALTLGTGAAYTKDQLESYRQAYFPAYGDEPKTIADKQARLQNVISAANIAAGKAAKSVAKPPSFTLPNARGGVDTSNPLLR